MCHRLFPEEPKRCHRGTKGKDDRLCINQHIPKRLKQGGKCNHYMHKQQNRFRCSSATSGYHHVVPQISLILSRHFSLSFIASGRSSGQHLASSHSCCMYVRAGRSAFARLYVGVHRSTSLMSSSLLLHQCPACVFRLTWIVCDGRQVTV